MREFAIAADRAEPDPDEADGRFEIKIGDRKILAKLPSTGQISVLMGSRGLSSNLSAIHRVLRAVLTAEDYDFLIDLLTEDKISVGFLFGGDDLNESGILDTLVYEAVGRPTQSPSGSGKSQSSAGRRSTGRAPGKGSTSTTSPPTDS